MRAAPASHTDLETACRARRGLVIYFAIVVALSAVIQAVIITRPDLDGLIAGLMLVPTVASMVARFALKEGFSDASFRLGGRRGRRAIVQTLIFPVGKPSALASRSVESPAKTFARLSRALP